MQRCSGGEQQHVGYKAAYEIAAKPYTTPASYIAAESATASTATYVAPLNATGTYLPASTTYTAPSSYVPVGSAHYPSSTAITTSAPLSPAAAYTVKNAAPPNFTGTSSRLLPAHPDHVRRARFLRPGRLRPLPLRHLPPESLGRQATPPTT